MASRPVSGSPPSSRTRPFGAPREQPDDRTRDRREPVQRRAEQACGASERCSASRLGTSSPTTSVTNEISTVTPMNPIDAGQVPRSIPASTRAFLAWSDRVTAPNALDSSDVERDADLDGGEEPVRVSGQPGDGRAAPAALGHRAHLSVAQRDQRDLGRDEQCPRSGSAPGRS